MTNVTQPRRFAAWLPPALLSIAGCAGDDGALARSEASLDLDTCFGAEIVCDPAAVPSEELSLPASRTCDGEMRAPVEREFLLELPDLDECEFTSETSSCTTSTTLSAFALGQDNASWWLFLGSKALVARYDAEGRLLGTTNLAPLVSLDADSHSYSGDIALDERGHAFVVLHVGRKPDVDIRGWSVDEHARGWFIELDPQGWPVRDPTPLGTVGYLHVAPAPEGVLIAGKLARADDSALLAELGPSGARVWSQTDVRGWSQTDEWGFPGVTALAAGDSGHAMVIAQREAGDDITRWGLMRFDPAGNVLWDHVFDLPAYGATDGLIAARNGSAVISAHWSVGDRSLPPKPSDYYSELVAHVRADGSADWVYQFTGAEPASIAVHPENGDVYVSVRGGVIGEESLGLDFLAVISADGGQCIRYALNANTDLPPIPGSGVIRNLAIDAEGRIYGTALRQRDFRIDPGLGRWSLPAQ